MNITVRFNAPINYLIGHDSIDIVADCYRDITSACSAMLPKFNAMLKDKKPIAMVCNDRLVSKQQLDFKISNSEVTIVPVVCGGASSFDSLGNLNIFYGANKIYDSESMLLTGIDRRIADSALFGKSSTAFDMAQRKQNREDGTLEGNEDPTTGFGALTLSSIYGQPVPLHFGLVRTSGIVLNSYIKHIQRGKVDNVRVSDYVE